MTEESPRRRRRRVETALPPDGGPEPAAEPAPEPTPAVDVAPPPVPEPAPEPAAEPTHWTLGRWHRHPLYTCRYCRFATLHEREIRRHVAEHLGGTTAPSPAPSGLVDAQGRPLSSTRPQSPATGRR